MFLAPLSSRCGFPKDHAQRQGSLPAVWLQIRERLAGYDLILVVDAPAFTNHVSGEGPHMSTDALY